MSDLYNIGRNQGMIDCLNSKSLLEISREEFPFLTEERKIESIRAGSQEYQNGYRMGYNIADQFTLGYTKGVYDAEQKQVFTLSCDQTEILRKSFCLGYRKGVERNDENRKRKGLSVRSGSISPIESI